MTEEISNLMFALFRALFHEICGVHWQGLAVYLISKETLFRNVNERLKRFQQLSDGALENIYTWYEVFRKDTLSCRFSAEYYLHSFA